MGLCDHPTQRRAPRLFAARSLAIAAAALLVSILPLTSGPVGLASAAHTRTGAAPPTLILTPASGPPGTTVTASGAGFGATEPVTLAVDGTTVAVGTTSAAGAVTALRFTLPNPVVGAHMVRVRGVASGQAQSATFTVTGAPTVVLSPSSGGPGTGVAVSGSGFGASEPITVSFDGTQMAANASTGTGMLSGIAFSVPNPVAAGPHTVTVRGTTSGRSQSAAFSVLEPTSLTLAPNPAVPGAAVAATGSGFGAGEAIAVALDGTPVVTGTATQVGTLSGITLTVPSPIAAGPHTVTARGTTSGRSQSTSLTVTGQPTLALVPQTGIPGSTVTLVGVGFGATEPITVAFDGTPVVTGTSTSVGTLPTLTFVVPAPTAAGPHTVTVRGTASGRVQNTTFTVGGQTSIGLTPAVGGPGTTVTITGTGFGASEPITVSFDSTPVVTGTSSSTGAVAGLTVTVPSPIAAGVHQVVARGTTSGRSQSAAFTVNAPAGLTLSSPAATPGATVTVSGTGFAGDEPVLLQFDTTPISLTRAVANGTFSGITFALPSSSTGSHTIAARGVQSGQVASTSFAVLPPATLALTPTIVSQGGLSVTSGAGSQPGEQVALALAGQGVARFAVSTAGSFGPVGIGVPFTTTTGAQPVMASGLTSGRVATATLDVVALRPTLTVNTLAVMPGTGVTLNGCGFGIGESLVVALNGSALATVPAVLTATTTGCFSTAITVPASLLSGANALAVSGVSSRATAQVTLVGTLPVASTAYFAGASTGTGETPRLAVLNPNDQPATLTLTVLYAAHAPVTTPLTVAANARLTVDLRPIAGADAHFGLALTANRRVAASLTELRQGADQWRLAGVSAPDTTWYLAEGYTGLTFKESITVLNPTTTPSVVTLQLLPFNGRPARTFTYTVAAQSEQVISVNALMKGLSLSAIVTSTAPVVVQRTMTFGSGDFGAHAKTGVNRSSASWYFAEGSTLNNFETFLTVLNPSQTEAAFVTASYYASNGASLGNQTIRIEPLHRGNLHLNEYVRSNAISTILSANVPVVAERPLYFGPPNGGPTGGSVVFGRNGTGTSWTFPAGNTVTMKEFLLLLNPSSQSADVTVRFYTTEGQIVSKSLSITPFTRYTLDVNRDVAGLPAGEHSAVVTSTNGVGIVVEQSIYDSVFRAGSSSQGIAQ